MVLELLFAGFVSAIGWWSANHFVIEPYFPPKIERKEENKKIKEKKADDSKTEPEQRL